jgi:CBS domain-containing membrane protein
MSISTCCLISNAASRIFRTATRRSDHIFSAFRKLRLDWLLLHFPPRLVRSVYVFVNGFVTIGALALLALARGIRLSDTLLAHLRLCGIRGHRRWSSAIRSASGHLLARVLAAALSLSATGAFMLLLAVSHPPAGATTLIVSPGIVSKPCELAIIEVAVNLPPSQSSRARLADCPHR